MSYARALPRWPRRTRNRRRRGSSSTGSGRGPPRALPRQRRKGRLAREVRMEEIEPADLTGAERIVEDCVVVEATHRVLTADLGQYIVEGPLPREDRLPIRLRVGR